MEELGCFAVLVLGTVEVGWFVVELEQPPAVLVLERNTMLKSWSSSSCKL